MAQHDSHGSLVHLAPRIWISSSIAAAMIGLFGFMTYGNLTGTPGYREARVQRENLQAAVVTTGRTQPFRRIDARSPLSGRAEQVLVQVGDKVKAGQVLVWTSTTERAEILDAARTSRPAEYEKWRERLPMTAILAPVSGTVVQRNIEPGQTFTEADPVIVLSDEVIVECPVDEIEVSKLHVGQRATASLDSYPDVTLPGSIKSISYEAVSWKNGNNVKTYMVRLEFDHIPAEIRVGMTANVKFETLNKPNVLTLPVEALRSDETSYFVLTPGGFGQDPEHRPVRLGESDGKHIEVLDGLKEGDIVLVDSRAPKRPHDTKGAFKVDAPADL